MNRPSSEMFPQLADDHRIALFLLMLLLFLAVFWWWNRSARKWLEENGREEEFADRVQWFTGESPPKPTPALRYSEQEFREMVASALDEIPEEFDKEWKNVAVIVSTDWPSLADRKKMNVPDDHLLLGMYSGISRAGGVHSESAQHLIVIYQPSIERLCGNERERIERQIRKTVLHELAHHLGMSHERMRKVGL